MGDVYVELSGEEQKKVGQIFGEWLEIYMWMPFFDKYVSKSPWYKWLASPEGSGYVGQTITQSSRQLNDRLHEIHKERGLSWIILDSDNFDKISYTSPEHNHKIYWYRILKGTYEIENYKFLLSKGKGRLKQGIMVSEKGWQSNAGRDTSRYPLPYFVDPITDVFKTYQDKIVEDLKEGFEKALIEGLQ